MYKKKLKSKLIMQNINITLNIIKTLNKIFNFKYIYEERFILNIFIL